MLPNLEINPQLPLKSLPSQVQTATKSALITHKPNLFHIQSPLDSYHIISTMCHVFGFFLVSTVDSLMENWFWNSLLTLLRYKLTQSLFGSLEEQPFLAQFLSDVAIKALPFASNFSQWFSRIKFLPCDPIKGNSRHNP